MRKARNPPTTPSDFPPALIGLPFPFQHMLQRLAALFGLPDLIGILVLIEVEKLLVSLQCRLWLVQLIVANRADKPDARARLFHFSNLVHGRQRRWIISGQEKRRTQVLEIGEVFAVQMERHAQLFLGRRKVPFLQLDAAQAAMELRIAGGQSQSLLKGGARILPLLRGHLYVPPTFH